jgi:hypothetical protein
MDHLVDETKSNHTTPTAVFERGREGPVLASARLNDGYAEPLEREVTTLSGHPIFHKPTLRE